MKAITLYQPWATLVAIGAKKIETRSWRTNYLGPLAIHASKTFPGWARALCREEPFRSELAKAGYTNIDDLPLGQVVAICKLYDCEEIKNANVPRGKERYFGDYRRGRFMWFLRDVKRLEKPVPVRGHQGLWEWGWGGQDAD